MAKSASNTGKSSLAGRLRSIRYWPVLLAGILLAVAGIFLWQQSASATLSDQLLRKVPKDSQLAGVARLSRLDYDTIRQVSGSAKIEPKRTGDLLSTLSKAGITPEELRLAFDDQFAFGRTPRGDLAIFTVAQDQNFSTLASKFETQTGDLKAVERPIDAGTVKLWQGTVRETGAVVTAFRSGREFYVSSNPDLIVAASREADGFTSLENFSDASKRLPPAADGYLFVNVAQLKDLTGKLPVSALTGIAWTNRPEELAISAYSSNSLTVTERLPRAKGAILPGTDYASVSLEGQNVVSFLHLLEDQRQETDLPRVINLQNGLASLNRKLGVDLEPDYLGGNHPFAYGRFRDAEGKSQWFGALEFDSPEAATAKITDLVQRLRDRVTVPVRKEVVRILPDGSQSREIVSEGRQSLTITDLPVNDRTAQTTTLPTLGGVAWVLDRQYLVVGSSADAISRMLKTLAGPSAKTGERGELAVRMKLADLGTLSASSDSLFDWILAARPDSGRFSLGKSSGELRGAVEFKETK
jgi:hypothetical protein